MPDEKKVYGIPASSLYRFVVETNPVGNKFVEVYANNHMQAAGICKENKLPVYSMKKFGKY